MQTTWTQTWGNKKCALIDQDILQGEKADKHKPHVASSLMKWGMRRLAWFVFWLPSGLSADLISFFMLVKEMHLKLLLPRWPLSEYHGIPPGIWISELFSLVYLWHRKVMMSLDSGHFLEQANEEPAGLFGNEEVWLTQLCHAACWEKAASLH